MEFLLGCPFLSGKLCDPSFVPIRQGDDFIHEEEKSISIEFVAKTVGFN